MFGAVLAAALVTGLFLSFRPTGFEPQEVAGEEETTEAPRPNSGGNGDGNGGGNGGRRNNRRNEEPSEAASEGMTDEEAEELIAAARDPKQTSVQVLDAGGGSSATDAVQAALLDLGYDVVAVNASRVNYPATTILYTDGNEAEAEALRARDDRFVETAPNERLSDGVDLHIVVGPDFEG